MKKKYLVLILIGLLMMGCGQSKSVNDFGSSDNSSRDVPNDLTDPTRNLNGRLANCNGFDGDDNDISGLVSTFVDGFTGLTDFNQIRLQFTNLPSEVISDGDAKIEMRLWHEQTQNNIVNAPNATKYRLQHKSTAYYVSEFGDSYGLTTDPNQAVELSELDLGLIFNIQDDINASYPDFYSGEIGDFFDNTIFVLQDVTITYQAVSVNMYPMSGGDALESTQFLIPPFYANPNTYAATHDSTNLILLHPNYEARATELSDDEFYLITNNFCEDML